MTGYLIDTNVISELRNGRRANEGVRAWFEANADTEIWLSVLVVGELRRGAALVRRRDAESANRLDMWLISLETTYADRLLPVTLDVARQWAMLGLPDPLPVIDGLLAATAISHELIVVTRNSADISRSGAACENPFT
ncbi:MAG: type II toxin-antitoxin system VapC family toxin [Acidimicrobiales bacterium]